MQYCVIVLCICTCGCTCTCWCRGRQRFQVSFLVPLHRISLRQAHSLPGSSPFWLSHLPNKPLVSVLQQRLAMASISVGMLRIQTQVPMHAQQTAFTHWDISSSYDLCLLILEVPIKLFLIFIFCGHLFCLSSTRQLDYLFSLLTAVGSEINQYPRLAQCGPPLGLGWN